MAESSLGTIAFIKLQSAMGDIQEAVDHCESLAEATVATDEEIEALFE